MDFKINSNNNTFGIVRNINFNWGKLTNSFVKLSSGLKINSASDSPAVLVISEQLRSQIASLNQKIENIDSQIYKYQYASATVSQLRSNVTELRTLAIGAANEGGNNEYSQAAYQSSADYIVSNYNYVVETADYNGSNILDGSENALASVSNLDNVDFSSAQTAEMSIEQIDQAIVEIDSVQIDIGARQADRLEPEKSNLEVTKWNLIAAESNLRDVDHFKVFIDMIIEMIRSKINIALASHSNITSQSVIELLSTK